LNLPKIGQGTGENSWTEEYANVLRFGVSVGMNFIDTAECYGNEEVVGKAIKEIRRDVILATKFSPENSYNINHSLERSLKKLGTDYVDIYQMHWPYPGVPLQDIVGSMIEIKKQGKVKEIGLSNLYVEDLVSLGNDLREIYSIQLEYNLFDRSIEHDMVQFCDTNDVKIIGYSPLDQGRIVDGNDNKKVIKQIADKYEKTEGQIVLQWLVKKSNVLVIPASKNKNRTRDNGESMSFNMEEKDFEKIDSITGNDISYIAAKDINVVPQGRNNSFVYTTLQEAKENQKGFCPSPVELAEHISEYSNPKPVRVVRNEDSFDLVEGRTRYWAMVIANGFESKIPVYIRGY